MLEVMLLIPQITAKNLRIMAVIGSTAEELKIVKVQQNDGSKPGVQKRDHMPKA